MHLGTTYGFAMLRRQRRVTSGGGGGGGIVGFKTHTLTVSDNFASGEVEIPLDETPFDVDGLAVDYNGQSLILGTEFSYSGVGNKVVITFSDAYVLDYDASPIFQVKYPY
jgi:hypothetical protein